MQLYALLENNAKTSLPDMEITGLTDDSRKVQPGNAVRLHPWRTL